MSLENEAAGAERILALLKRRGPQRVAGIAAALGISGEAVRQQLVRLNDLDLVDARAEIRGVGRPAREWALTDAGHARFPDRHAEVTLQLIEAVRAEFGEAALDRMIDRRDAAMRASYASALAPLAGTGARLRRLAAIRSREGYMAEVTRLRGGGWLLVENHCPICTAAAACAGFCRSELDVFRSALGAGVTIERTEHILAGARRCAYRVGDVKE